MLSGLNLAGPLLTMSKSLLRILPNGFVHLDSFLCIATTKPGFLLPNVPRWNEYVATDPFFSDIPARDDGIPGLHLLKLLVAMSLMSIPYFISTGG